MRCLRTWSLTINGICGLQLGRTWYPSESASLRRLDLLRMLERLFGLEELSDEAEDAGTAEVEFMGSGAAGQAAAQKQVRVELNILSQAALSVE